MMVKSVCAALALLAYGVGPAQAQSHVREPLSEFLQDSEKVLSLLRGVATMKARDEAPKDSAQYRTSWEYWTAIHGYPGPEDGTINDWQQLLAQEDPDLAPLLTGLYSGLEDLSAPDPLAAEVWSTCQHGTDHFFTWHRMYLYFFERVLRAASGNQNFALPYWDYTAVGTPAEEPWRLPRLFTLPRLPTPGGEIANPLYEPRRTPGFGTLVQLDSAATDIDGVLVLDEFQEFQSSIDGGVHAYVHCAVGNGCLAPRMGIVPFAAGDPIFWHHHANVDRVWSCWLDRHGTGSLPSPDSEWMRQTYIFVDEAGARVEMTVAELFDPNGRIDYVYERTDAPACFRRPPATVVAEGGRENAPMPNAGAGASTASAAPSGRLLARDIELTEMSTTIVAADAAEVAAAAGVTAGAEDSGAIGSGAAVLRLHNVDAKAQPGALIAVELTHARTGERRRVGTVAFFALKEDGAGHAHGGDARNYSFDVTSALRDLRVASLDEVTVELRVEGLVSLASGAPPVPLEGQATHDTEQDKVAAALLELDTEATRELLAQTGARLPAEAVQPEAGAEAAAAAEERFRRANVTVGEIVLELGV